MHFVEVTFFTKHEHEQKVFVNLELVSQITQFDDRTRIFFNFQVDDEYTYIDVREKAEEIINKL